MLWFTYKDQNQKHMEMQNQRTETPADFTVPSRTARSSHQKSCIRKLLLDILQYPQETPVLEFIFEKVAYF